MYLESMFSNIHQRIGEIWSGLSQGWRVVDPQSSSGSGATKFGKHFARPGLPKFLFTIAEDILASTVLSKRSSAILSIGSGWFARTAAGWVEKICQTCSRENRPVCSTTSFRPIRVQVPAQLGRLRAYPSVLANIYRELEIHQTRTAVYC